MQKTKARSQPAASPFQASGTTIRTRRRGHEAPDTAAASSIDRGTIDTTALAIHAARIVYCARSPKSRITGVP
jgi:hypothetical protein